MHEFLAGEQDSRDIGIVAQASDKRNEFTSVNNNAHLHTVAKIYSLYVRIENKGNSWFCITKACAYAIRNFGLFQKKKASTRFAWAKCFQMYFTNDKVFLSRT